jgi:hypothetical protein
LLRHFCSMRIQEMTSLIRESVSLPVQAGILPLASSVIAMSEASKAVIPFERGRGHRAFAAMSGAESRRCVASERAWVAFWQQKLFSCEQPTPRSHH